MFRRYFLPLIAFVFYRVLSWTWRIRIVEPEPLANALERRQPVVLAHWHGDELALLAVIRRYRIATMASQSKDGELMARLLTRLGARVTRGSPKSGSVQALKGLLRLVRQGANCSFAVDGPRGPLHKAKAGVFELSRVTAAPLYAAGVACDRAIHFPKSWNRTFLPKPFARVVICWLGPLPPVARDADARNPALALELETLLHRARRDALAHLTGRGLDAISSAS